MSTKQKNYSPEETTAHHEAGHAVMCSLPDEATAHHEAGHAVMCFLLGRRVAEVSIIPDSQNLGFVRKGPLPRVCPELSLDAEARKTLTAEILIAAAGPVAEQCFTGRKSLRGCGPDLEHMFDTACALHGGDWERAEECVNQMMQAARRILTEPAHWRGVEALARELLERPEMEGHQVKEVIERALGTEVRAPLDLDALPLPSGRVFRGIPTFFRALCKEAGRAVGPGYQGAGYELARHATALVEGEDETEKDGKLANLQESIRRNDGVAVLSWFEEEFPACLILVPKQRRGQFVRGVFCLVEDHSGLPGLL